MRALILRRVGLLEGGVGGPVIVGRAGDADVLAPGRIPRAERTSAPSARSRHRRERPDTHRGLPRRHLGAADRALPERPHAAESERGRARRLPRPRPCHRSDQGVRRRDRRRGTGGARRGGLRRIGRSVRHRARLPRVRRPGGRVGADRELPRLSDRNQRDGLDGPRLQPGAEVRRRDGDPGRGGAPRAQRRRRWRALPGVARERRTGQGPCGRDRQRRQVSPPRGRESRGLRRGGRALLGFAPGGQAVRRTGGGAGRCGQLRWPGGGVSREPGRQGLAARARREPRGEHVALSGRPHRRACRTSRCCSRPRSSRSKATAASWRRSAGAAYRRARRRAGRSAICSCSSARTRTPTWLSGSGVALDAKGFVRTGADVGEGRRPLETSRHGVFAIGDVRAGSTKRVAAAVGEGAQVVAAIHAFLAGTGERGEVPHHRGA